MANGINNMLANKGNEVPEGGLNTNFDIENTVNEIIKNANTSVNNVLGFSDSKIIQEILNLDISENPNMRNALIYKYMRRLLKPLIRESVLDINS